MIHDRMVNLLIEECSAKTLSRCDVIGLSTAMLTFVREETPAVALL